jgi:hypothetical protein
MAEPQRGIRRLRIDRVGECLLVSDGEPRSRAVADASCMPAEDGRIPVMVPDIALSMMPEIAGLLSAWVPGRFESVRLVAAHAAAEAGDRPSPAQDLSNLLGVEVVAPDGQLARVPGGSLFVMGGRGGGAWWRLRPGRPPEVNGRRFPTPQWERDLAPFTGPAIAGVAVDEVPAGLWMHWSGKGSPTDLAYAVPAHATAPALVVSRPGDPPLRAEQVRRLVEAMPAAFRDRLVVFPYGDRPVADSRLGAAVSLPAHRSPRVGNGLPRNVSGHRWQVVAIGSDGLPTWSPFAVELVWRSHGGARVVSWTAPADYLLPVGPAQFALNERWLVEVIEAGLWLRRVDRVDGAETVRQLPLDSRHCTVVVGTPEADRVQPPWRAIVRLLRELPVEARTRLLLTVPWAGHWMAGAAARAGARVLDGGQVCLLAEDGRVVPYLTYGERHDRRRGQPDDPVGTRRARGFNAEEAALISFVEQLRRTRAWDELPAGEEVAGPEPEAKRPDLEAPTRF